MHPRTRQLKQRNYHHVARTNPHCCSVRRFMQMWSDVTQESRVAMLERARSTGKSLTFLQLMDAIVRGDPRVYPVAVGEPITDQDKARGWSWNVNFKPGSVDEPYVHTVDLTFEYNEQVKENA